MRTPTGPAPRQRPLRNRLLAAGGGLVLLAGLVLVLGAGLGSAPGTAARSAMVGRPAPALSGPTLHGGTFTLHPARARATLVTIWASWCGPCRREMPLLSEAARAARGSGVRVVTVDTRDGPEAARTMLEELHIDNLVAVQDPDGEIAVAWGAAGIPETFVVDRHGVVRAHRAGPLTEDWLHRQVSRWGRA